MEICFFHGNCHGKEANKIYFINIKYIFYNIYDERIYGTCMCVLYIDHINIRVMILNKWYELHETFLFYARHRVPSGPGLLVYCVHIIV